MVSAIPGRRVSAYLCSILATFSILAAPASSLAFGWNDAHRVNGRVVHAETKDPLPGVTVRLVETGSSSVTDGEGCFSFEEVSIGSYTLVVSHPDYVTQRITVEVPAVTVLEIEAPPWPRIAERVTVTATPWEAERLEVAQSTDVRDIAEVRVRSGVSVGEAVKDVPGVRNISTGETGGVPMIRGQTNERTRVLSNGFPHDYYQFSRRHMPNIEPYESATVEVVRGPASVLYGTQAVGGLVNLVSAPLPTTSGGSPIFRGEGLFGYAGNNDSKTGHARLEGGSGGFGGRAAWTQRSAGNVTTPEGELPNTDYDQRANLVEAGYQFQDGLRFRGHYKYWENDLGFYIPNLPDFRLNLRNDIGELEAGIPSALGEWQLAANWSRNIRRAFPLGRSQGAKVDLELNTQTYRASLQHKPAGPLRGWIRLEHARQENESFGPVTLLPFYQNRTWAAAVFEEVRLARSDDLDRVILNLGLRYDHRKLEVPANPGRDIPEDVAKTYSPFTGSLGIVYRFNPVVSAGLSIGRGWRNPSEFELFADGPHDGALLYQTGNPELEEETNLNTEITLRLNDDRLRGYLAAFYNRFDNYIYLRLTGEERDGLPVSAFDQSDANIKGFEGQLAVDATQRIRLMLAGETLRTTNDATGTRLPFTPPDRLGIGARFHDGGSVNWSNPYLEVRATWTGEGKIAGLDEPFPLDTEAYTLFDLGAGIQRGLGSSILSFDLWISNLTNKAYKDFLDTYKLYALSPGRNVRFTVRLLF